jgi:hypothetical protein
LLAIRVPVREQSVNAGWMSQASLLLRDLGTWFDQVAGGLVVVTKISVDEPGYWFSSRIGLAPIGALLSSI